MLSDVEKGNNLMLMRLSPVATLNSVAWRELTNYRCCLSVLSLRYSQAQFRKQTSESKLQLWWT